MAALETTLFVSAKTSKDSKYQWYDYVRMLEHFSTFGRLWMLDINSFSISQTFDRNYLKQISCMEKAIAQHNNLQLQTQLQLFQRCYQLNQSLLK